MQPNSVAIKGQFHLEGVLRGLQSPAQRKDRYEITPHLSQFYALWHRKPSKTAQALLATCNLLLPVALYDCSQVFSLYPVWTLFQLVFHEPRILLRDEKLLYTTWKDQESKNETEPYQKITLSSYCNITMLTAAGSGFYCLRFQSHKGCVFVQEWKIKRSPLRA